MSVFILCVLDVFEDWGFIALFLSFCFCVFFSFTFSFSFSLSFSFSSNGIHIFELFLFISFSFSFFGEGFLNSFFSSFFISSSIFIFSNPSCTSFFLFNVSAFLSFSSKEILFCSQKKSIGLLFCSFIFVVSKISKLFGSFIPLSLFLNSKFSLYFNFSSSLFTTLFLSLSSSSNDKSESELCLLSLLFCSKISSSTASSNLLFSCSLATVFSFFSFFARILVSSFPPILLFSISNKVISFLGEFSGLYPLH